MMEHETNNGPQGFEYTYSAQRQQEVQRIRQKYLPDQPDKLEQLRRLDKSAAAPGTAAALALGIPGMLLFGAGLTVCIQYADTLLALGLALGIPGMALMGLAFPAYQWITRRRRKKLAPQILKLTEELLD